jgi:glutamine amidotransferase PdxT
VDVLYAAFPVLIVPVPSVVLPSMKVTVPVTFVGDMAAVNLTEAPYVEGFADEVSVTVGLAWSTVWVSAGEMLALSFVSPP